MKTTPFYPFLVTYWPRVGDCPAHYYTTTAGDAVAFADRAAAELAERSSPITLSTRGEGFNFAPQLVTMAAP